jgi:hypothetical protein
MWHTDPLLDNNRKTNETTDIARQQLLKHATVLEPLLGQRPACNNGSNVGSGVFYESATRLYHSTARVKSVGW